MKTRIYLFLVVTLFVATATMVYDAAQPTWASEHAVAQLEDSEPAAIKSRYSNALHRLVPTAAAGVVFGSGFLLFQKPIAARFRSLRKENC